MVHAQQGVQVLEDTTTISTIILVVRQTFLQQEMLVPQQDKQEELQPIQVRTHGERIHVENPLQTQQYRVVVVETHTHAQQQMEQTAVRVEVQIRAATTEAQGQIIM